MPWGWEADDKYLPTVSRLSLAALLALSCPILTLRTFPIVPHLCFTGIASLGILITCYLKFSMLFLFNQSSLLLFALIFVFPNQDFLKCLLIHDCASMLKSKPLGHHLSNGTFTMGWPSRDQVFWGTTCPQQLRPFPLGWPFSPGGPFSFPPGDRDSGCGGTCYKPSGQHSCGKLEERG